MCATVAMFFAKAVRKARRKNYACTNCSIPVEKKDSLCQSCVNMQMITSRRKKEKERKKRKKERAEEAERARVERAILDPKLALENFYEQCRKDFESRFGKYK